MQLLLDRTNDVCAQLTRYFCVYSHELLDVLDAIVEINDDLHNSRDRAAILEQINEAKRRLDRVREAEV